MPTELFVNVAPGKREPAWSTPTLNFVSGDLDGIWWLPCDNRTVAVIHNTTGDPITITVHTEQSAGLGRGAASDDVDTIPDRGLAYIGPFGRDGFEDPAKPGFMKFTLSEHGGNVTIMAVRK